MTVRIIGYVLSLVLVTAACTGSENKNGGRTEAPSGNKRAKLAAGVAIGTAPAPKGDWLESACALPAEELLRIARGYSEERSPDLMVVPRSPNFFGSFTVNSHSGPWDYLQRIPLVFYGPGFIRPQGEIEPQREVTSIDIAPTIADLVGMEWPSDRPSSALTKALLPQEQRNGRPRVVVTVVWDGGGRDVLDQWPTEWPNLKKMIAGGTSFGNATVGSSPSVTPAVHANLGTGTWPIEHGIGDILLRVDGKIVGSWAKRSPQNLLTPTLADLYDQEENNAAEIAMIGDHGWHLGMIGHGAFLEGGDRDFAIVAGSGGTKITNRHYYELPAYIRHLEGFEEDVRTIDTEDGEADSRWLDNDILDDPKLVQETPAATIYQTRVIKKLLTQESFGQDEIPDLLFTNYKQIDYVGHRYNMLQPEMGEVVRYSDQELGELMEFLDDWVGEEQWVIALTADHGSTPDAEATKAWPINTAEILGDLAEHFELPENEIIDATRYTGFWTNREGLAANGIALEEVAEFLLDMRAKDTAVAKDELPPGYEQRLDEPIFSAVWLSENMDEVLQCAGVEV